MDPEEVVYWCTAGTPLGEKLSAASEADLATLSPNVTAVLSEENMQQCMEMVMEEMAEELATATAGIQCFLHMFQDSCKEFVGAKVYEALYSTLVPLAG